MAFSTDHVFLFSDCLVILLCKMGDMVYWDAIVTQTLIYSVIVSHFQVMLFCILPEQKTCVLKNMKYVMTSFNVKWKFSNTL